MKRAFGVTANTPPAILRATAPEAERMGYAEFWINSGPTNPFDTLELLGGATERIPLGLGIVSLQTHDTPGILEDARTHTLPMDRVMLGVGMPGKGALARVRAAVETLRSELDCAIVMAASGPKMCRMAGELADHVVSSWQTPEGAKRCIQWVQEGADAAGRDRPPYSLYVRVALGTQPAARVEQAAAFFAASGTDFEAKDATPLATSIVAEHPDEITAALNGWQDAVDTIVLRVLPTQLEAQDEYVRILQAGAPA